MEYYTVIKNDDKDVIYWHGKTVTCNKWKSSLQNNMDCNEPILNKYIHVSMYIFLWEKLCKDKHQNVNRGYHWVAEF